MVKYECDFRDGGQIKVCFELFSKVKVIFSEFTITFNFKFIIQHLFELI